MSRVFLFFVLTLASYRLQRLVTTDEWPPSKWLRDKVAARWGPDSSWSYLVSCPWCSGLWVCLFVFYGVSLFIDVPLPFFQAMAAGAIVGLLAEREEPPDPS